MKRASPRCAALYGVAIAAVGVSAQVRAEMWPNRPVHMMVAGAPGSAPDITARIIGHKLSDAWGQQIIVENKPGAAGNLGTATAAAATPDGYTLLFGQAAPLAVNRWIFKTLAFDVDRDFTPVINIGLSPMMIAANRDLPVKTIGDLIALCKSQPGKLSFSTSSSRNIPHLTGELLKRASGCEMAHIPYVTNTQAIADVATGRTQLMIDGLPVLLPHTEDGRLNALAVSSAKRLPGLEAVPTIAKSLPGFVVNGWFAILAPAGTSSDVINRVNQDSNRVLQDQDVTDRLRGLGVYAEGGSPRILRGS